MVFYKYIGTVFVNRAFILFFSGCMGSLFYQVYWKVNCVADNIIALNRLNILVWWVTYKKLRYREG